MTIHIIYLQKIAKIYRQLFSLQNIQLPENKNFPVSFMYKELGIEYRFSPLKYSQKNGMIEPI